MNTDSTVSNFEKLSSLWEEFSAIAYDKKVNGLICVFDVLDGCEEDGRKSLFHNLNDLYKTHASSNGKRPSFRTLVTSQPYIKD